MKRIVTINPRFEALRPEIERLAQQGVPGDAECIYRGRNTLSRVRMVETDTIVKAFKRPSVLNSWVYGHLRSSKAQRSFENAAAMRALGFDSPEPVAWIECRKGGRLCDSYYVSLELKNASEMRHWEERPDADALTRAFAAEIARMHKAGVLHLDFSPGNILVTGGAGADSPYVFHYVDMNRMQFGVKERSRLNRMFRALNLNPDPLRTLAREYALFADCDPQSAEKQAMEQLQGYLDARTRKQRLKRILGLKPSVYK